MAKATERIIWFVVDRLPDSITERRGILEALVATFPKADVPRALLSSLDSHLVDQRELSLTPDTEARGSGRLGDDPIERGTPVLGDQPKERGGRK
jgi:hypothetical protein